MSAPLSLRVCCMTAMAPALTEAATQARIKLTSSSPPTSTGSTKFVVNGRGQHRQTDIQHLKGKSLESVTSQIAFDQLEKVHRKGVLKPIGYRQIKVANLNNLRYISDFKDFNKKEVLVPVSLRNGNHIDDLEMNQPAPVNGISENGDQTGMCGKNGLKQSLCENKLNGAEEVVSNCNKTPKSLNNIKINKPTESQETKMVASTSTLEESVSSLPPVENNILDTSEMESNVDSLPQVENLNEEISKKQHLLERRTQHLLRRLRRMQGRQLDGHIRSQLGGFVDFQRRDLQTVAKSIRLAGSNISAADIKAELLQSEDVKSLSTASLVNLVRRLQSSQGSVNFSHRPTLSRVKQENDSVGVLMIDENICQESSRVSGNLMASQHHMKSCIDSDATESSSGGESCDENEVNDYVSEKKSQSLPLHRRAEWKWANDRASVASCWTWLQAQVSDLEYRIRQQSEIYKQIRHTKGSVLLGDPPIPEDLSKTLKQAKSGKLSPLDAKIANLEKKNEVSPCNISTLLMNVNKQASRLTQSLGNCLSPVTGAVLADDKLKGSNHSKPLNGVINSGQLSSNGNESDVTDTPPIGPGGDASSLEMSPAVDASCQSARCRPVRSYRKRKLLRTAGLHQISRKAARLSSVKCQCYPPVMSCPMCGGRYNNVQSIDPDVMPLNERVSLVDPAFHPVLSFNQEIPLQVHFEALLQSGEWQNKPPPKSAKALSAERRRQKLMAASVRDRVRKNSKYAKSAAAALLSSARLRNKYDRRSPTKQRNGTPKKKSAAEKRLHRNEMKRRRAAQLAIAALKRTNRVMSEDSNRYDMDSRATTPSPQFKDGLLLSSSCPTSTLKEMKDAALKKRKIENAYDINNIVIPYSMAASTRVEKLKYKEIVTPKWRDLTKEQPEEEESANVPEETEETKISVVEDTLSKEETVPEAEAEDTPVNEDDEEIEDLSDETFKERHMKCEIQEKKRFSTFVQYPSRRSRGSRAEIGPPSTPEQMSPVPPNFSESNLVQHFAGPSKDDVFRRRSSSVSSRRQSFSLSFDDNSMEMVEVTYHDPFPDRTFPLSEEEYEVMKAVQPPVSNSQRRRVPSARMSLASEFDGVRLEDYTPSSSRPCSPLPSSSSGSYVGEDPNDPEWTTISGERTPTKPKR